MQESGVELSEDWMNPYEFDDDSFPSGYVPSQPPAPAEYVFDPRNPFLQSENPFQEGIEMFQRGRLEEAIFAFESQLQKNPADSSDVWRWLGTAHAENDDDKLAITCLRNSVEADPENIEALLDIGVSYTNELNQHQALVFLKSWMKQHPEYQRLVDPDEKSEAGSLPWEKPDQVIDIFQRAASIVSDDPDIFTVLGVLYNLTRQFDLAEESFKKALQFDPTNHSLWNKLGATQANSPKPTGSKEAVKAYRKALEMKPNYVRAWVNMGISYANQGQYDVSAKYYLRALSLNNKAEHIWSYLKVALACMGREDLAELVHERDVNRFRKDFEF